MTGMWPKLPVGSMRYATVGIEFIGIFLIFLGAGMWLDGRWASGPWMTMTGMVVGFAAGFYRMIQVSREVGKLQEIDKKGAEGKDETNGQI